MRIIFAIISWVCLWRIDRNRQAVYRLDRWQRNAQRRAFDE